MRQTGRCGLSIWMVRIGDRNCQWQRLAESALNLLSPFSTAQGERNAFDSKRRI